VNFINGQKNITNYATLNFGPTIGYDFPDKYNFDFNPQIGYNTNVSSLHPSVHNTFYTFSGGFSGFIALPKKFEISTDGWINIQQRMTGFSSGANIILWNAQLARKVFKNNSGKIIFAVNDLLDQNRGFDRTITSNIIQEDSYSKISRYFLLKFEWTFNKMPGSK
jgi:hypothetical protein